MIEPDGYVTVTTDDLVEAAEPNPLLRRVDGLCETRSWDELVLLAQRCREAYERGKQLWPIAEHIDYRLALEAPAAYAAAVLTPTSGRFAFGPLTEVAASTHTFDDLAPHLPSPQVAGVVAAERVLRGEDLRGRADAHAEVLELPMAVLDWEPPYRLATYKAHDIEAPGPDLAPLRDHATPEPPDLLDEPDLARALLDLVTPWLTGSSGQAEAVVSDGPVPAAVGGLGHLRPSRFLLGEVTASEALELMAWAAASGGAHGRRRGAAAGRSAAWWACAALCDLPWPVPTGELASEVARLRWFRWEPPGPPGGWRLHLGVEDPEGGWSAALSAEDRGEAASER